MLGHRGCHFPIWNVFFCLSEFSEDRFIYSIRVRQRHVPNWEKLFSFGLVLAVTVCFLSDQTGFVSFSNKNPAFLTWLFLVWLKISNSLRIRAIGLKIKIMFEILSFEPFFDSSSPWPCLKYVVWNRGWFFPTSWRLHRVWQMRGKYNRTRFRTRNILGTASLPEYSLC